MSFSRDEQTNYIESLTNTNLIAAILQVSKRARDVYTSEAYRFTVEDEVFVDEQLVFDTMFETLLDELHTLGVELLLPISEIWQYRDYTACAIELRYRLDAEVLKEQLASMSTERWERFQQGIADKDTDPVATLIVLQHPYMLGNDRFNLLVDRYHRLFQGGPSCREHIQACGETAAYARGTLPVNEEGVIDEPTED